MSASSNSAVHVLTWRLLDYEGRDMTYGGLQRWILELAGVLQGMGREVLVHQRADRRFERQLAPGLTVHGHVVSTRAWGSPWFNLVVHRGIPRDAPVIYMIEDLAFPVCRRRSLVVQHGIWWDGEYGWFKTRSAERIARHAVRRSSGTICVDTNFINWFRARWPEAGVDRKLHFVPNFIDPDQWGPQPDRPAASALEGNRMTVCFPRRSEPRRGIHLMAEAAPRLGRRFPHLDFRFVVGSGFHTAVLRDRLRTADLPNNRWRIEVLPFDRMRAAYERSAIVTIPTVCSEGTSLSAIEAMYFGCAVVATWVGGLPNLIQDGRNGLLIPPDARALEEAVAQLVEQPALREAIGRNAMHESVELYGIQRWRKRVAPVLRDCLQLPCPPVEVPWEAVCEADPVVVGQP